ncbi:hypothetical protein T492DRAFT_881186 [Pavlovales sp. CCMP2436]|nr:hypothetical protein T492DRAFT_881186 [Pavlovales sp. CCMP2436]
MAGDVEIAKSRSGPCSIAFLGSFGSFSFSFFFGALDAAPSTRLPYHDDDDFNSYFNDLRLLVMGDNDNWNKGFREITKKDKTVVLGLKTIEQYLAANPTIQTRLKGGDKSDANAARTILLAWLTARGATSVPASGGPLHCICTYCGACGRSNPTEKMIHVAGTTKFSCSRWHPQAEQFRLHLAGTRSAGALGKGQQAMLSQADMMKAPPRNSSDNDDEDDVEDLQ